MLVVYCGVLIVLLVICAACASVKAPPKHYLTCTIFKVQMEDGRWLAKALTVGETEHKWMVFHNEVKEGWTVEYVRFVEEGDAIPHAQVHAIFSVDNGDAP